MEAGGFDERHLERQRTAVHRVASLVARQRPAHEVFRAVTEELGGLLEVEDARLVRFERDGSATVLASWGELADRVPDGTNRPLTPDSVLGAVQRTGRAARLDDYDGADAEIVRYMRGHGIRASVAGPIVVERTIWGALVAATRRPVPLPPHAEARIAQFSELVTTSISIVETREQLAASRARIVAATDQARQRFERDLHDGVEQRLHALAHGLDEVGRRIMPGHEQVAALLREVRAQLGETIDEVAELARGLHPAALERGGLATALPLLAERAALPVALTLELPERERELIDARVAATAYYVVSEALANAAKHAAAERVEVDVRLRGERLLVVVADDGVGGADAAGGSGLVGLADRVEALGGRLALDSPPGAGTAVRVTLPRAPRATAEEEERR